MPRRRAGASACLPVCYARYSRTERARYTDCYRSIGGGGEGVPIADHLQAVENQSRCPGSDRNIRENYMQRFPQPGSVQRAPSVNSDALLISIRTTPVAITGTP